jgi:hypothetical protein
VKFLSRRPSQNRWALIGNSRIPTSRFLVSLYYTPPRIEMEMPR